MTAKTIGTFARNAGRFFAFGILPCAKQQFLVKDWKIAYFFVLLHKIGCTSAIQSKLYCIRLALILHSACIIFATAIK